MLGVAADKFSGALVLGAGRRWRGRSWSEGEGGLAGHAPDLQIPPRQPAAAAADPIRQSAGSQAALRVGLHLRGEGRVRTARPAQIARGVTQGSIALPPQHLGEPERRRCPRQEPREARRPAPRASQVESNSRLFVAIARPGNQAARVAPRARSGCLPQRQRPAARQSRAGAGRITRWRLRSGRAPANGQKVLRRRHVGWAGSDAAAAAGVRLPGGTR